MLTILTNTKNITLFVISLGGTQWPQGELVATPQPLMTVQPGTVYGQYPQQTPQYQTQQPQQTAAVPAAETVVYYQQPQV